MLKVRTRHLNINYRKCANKGHSHLVAAPIVFQAKDNLLCFFIWYSEASKHNFLIVSAAFIGVGRVHIFLQIYFNNYHRMYWYLLQNFCCILSLHWKIYRNTMNNCSVLTKNYSAFPRVPMGILGLHCKSFVGSFYRLYQCFKSKSNTIYKRNK